MKLRVTGVSFLFFILCIGLMACQTTSQSIKPSGSSKKALDLYTANEVIAARLIESAKGSQNIDLASKVAVADFVGPNDRLTGLGSYMAEKLSVTLFNSGAFSEFMERRQLKQVIEAHKGELSGYFDQNTVQQFGKMIGVDAMVIGTIKDLGSFLDVTAKIVESGTGRIIALSDVRVKKDETTESLINQTQTATLTISVDPPVSGEVVAGGQKGYLENGSAVIKGLPYGSCSVVIQPRGYDQIRRSVTIGSPSETLSVKIAEKDYSASFQIIPPDAKLTFNGQAVMLNDQGWAEIKNLKKQQYSYVVQAKGHSAKSGYINPATQSSYLFDLDTSDPFLSLKNKFFEKYKQMEGRQDFGVKLWTNKDSYSIGDEIAFYFRADRDCYVTLVSINSSGSVTQIFPNRFHSNNKVQSGVTYQIPDDGYGFKFEVEPPGGVDRVYAIASTHPIELFQNNFNQSAFTSLTRGQTRDIGVKDVGVRLDSVQLSAATECIVRSN